MLKFSRGQRLDASGDSRDIPWLQTYISTGLSWLVTACKVSYGVVSNLFHTQDSAETGISISYI